MPSELKSPKYSIVVPAHNGGEFLPSCVWTVTSQPYGDFELIISDDHSTDSTSAYLEGLKDPRIRILHTDAAMSMAEHWEWALRRARGEWLMYLGQDDGLQPYFFELAEHLTRIARSRNIRVIASDRAYYYWPGCDEAFNYPSVDYRATSSARVCRSRYQAFKALVGIQNYFELPAMYTSSMFHRDIIEEAMAGHGGRLFVTHPQDANLAAIACLACRRYLRSSAPLGWVGTSAKSAGHAVIAANRSDTARLKAEYLERTSGSTLRYSPAIGGFELGSATLYFWGALLETLARHTGPIAWMLKSHYLKMRMFAAAMIELERLAPLRGSDNRHALGSIIEANGLSPDEVERCVLRTMPRLRRNIERFEYALNMPRFLRMLIAKALLGHEYRVSLSYHIARGDPAGADLRRVYSYIGGKAKEVGIVENMRLG